MGPTGHHCPICSTSLFSDFNLFLISFCRSLWYILGAPYPVPHCPSPQSHIHPSSEANGLHLLRDQDYPTFSAFSLFLPCPAIKCLFSSACEGFNLDVSHFLSPLPSQSQFHLPGGQSSYFHPHVFTVVQATPGHDLMPRLTITIIHKGRGMQT